MGPSHLTRCFSRSVFSVSLITLITAALAAIAPFAARAHDNLRPSTDDPATISGVADVRLTASEKAALEQELRSLDHTLIQAIVTNDGLAPARLLDAEFTWIDRDGRSRSKSDLVNRIGLLSAGADTNLTLQTYGRVALVTGTHRLMPDNAPAFFARVWIRQASGWRLLLYQETAAPDSSVKDAHYTVSRADWPGRCENPCRSLPYKPLSSDAQEIVASFMAGQKAVFDDDADTASRILGDDVLLTASSPSTKQSASPSCVTSDIRGPPFHRPQLLPWLCGYSAMPPSCPRIRNRSPEKCCGPRASGRSAPPSGN